MSPPDNDDNPPATIARIAQSVGRVEGKIDAFITQMGIQDTRTTNLEVRVRATEQRQHFYGGAGAVLGALAGFFGSHFIKS